MATRLISTAKRATDKERLSTLPQLEKASRTLARAAKVLFEEHSADVDVAALWTAVEGVAPRAAVLSAAATVVLLVPQDEDAAETAMRSALAPGTTRSSCSSRCWASRRRSREVDDKLVPPAWREAVYARPDLSPGAVDRDAYVVCVLEQLHRALMRRDVFASPSHRGQHRDDR